MKDEPWQSPHSGVLPPSTVAPSTIAPSTVTTPQTRRTIYLLAIVPLVLAIIAGVASLLSHEERAKPRPHGPTAPLSDAAPRG